MRLASSARAGVAPEVASSSAARERPATLAIHNVSSAASLLFHIQHSPLPRRACPCRTQRCAAAAASPQTSQPSSSTPLHLSRRRLLQLAIALPLASAVAQDAAAAAQPPPRQATGSTASTSSAPAAGQQQQGLPADDIRELIEAAVGRKQVSPVEYGRLRVRCGFKRLIDGRVALRNKAGRWVLVRPDLKVSGLLLLRDPDGQISIILTDAYRQIDLSDDISVAQFFSAGKWEDHANPITFRDRDGVKKPLKLTEIQFRTVVTLFEDDELERLSKLEREQRLSGGPPTQGGARDAADPQWKSWSGRGGR